MLSRSTAASFYIPQVTSETLEELALQKGMKFQARSLQHEHEFTIPILGCWVKPKSMKDDSEIAKLGLASFKYEPLKSFSQTWSRTMQANNAKSKGVSLAWNKFGGPKAASGA